MFIALCSDKGSPGVTTSALVLASASPEPSFLVEADPHGGDIGIRLRPGGNALPEAPTVLSLAAAARSDRDPGLLERYAHRLSETVAVIPAALRREQMAKVGDWIRVAEILALSERPVFADLGQIHASSPVAEIAAKADVVVVVARPDMTSIVRLRDRLARLGADLAALRGAPPRLFPLLLTTTRHGTAHMNDLQVLLNETPARPFLVGQGFLALDDRCVRKLEAGDDPTGRLARSDLMRSARTVVGDLVAASAPERASNPHVAGAVR
ncbi:MAG: hypothetical protein ABIS91_05265 [Nocardioides sp.]|uniref:hypothetical protein n=1 Tax=Nocardioides sp. TaxID=35761 RepID=UPI003265B51E